MQVTEFGEFVKRTQIFPSIIPGVLKFNLLFAHNIKITVLFISVAFEFGIVFCTHSCIEKVTNIKLSAFTSYFRCID
jgi:membrane protease subunit (stomatin/prohibitin family)